MKEYNEDLMRNCETCEDNEPGCENRCPYELVEQNSGRSSLLQKRKVEKAQRAGAITAAERVVSSAKKQKGQKNLHEKPKTAHVNAEKNLEKATNRRKKREEKNSK